MRPDDLDDAVPPEPDAVLLEHVRSRSVSFRKRRRAQRLASVCGAVVVLALVGGVAFASVDSSDSKNVATVTPTTLTTTPPEVTTAMLKGEWRPVSIAGYDGPLTSPPLQKPPRIRFTSDRDWTGSDGCNGQGGMYGLGAFGAIHFDMPFSEAMLCVPNEKTPQLELLPKATRVEVSDDRLTFFGPDGELAQYARRDVTARIVLPSTTMVAGSTMEGQVVVENNTGAVLHVIGCGSWFQIVLDPAETEPIVGWRDCRQDFTIPVGTSTYPAHVAASYLSCTSPPPGAPPECPPLPVGTYEATMFQQGEAVPPPPTVTVRVVGPGPDTTDEPPTIPSSTAPTSSTTTPPNTGAGITARLVLPSTTMDTGSTMKAHVVVENDTGHELHVDGCGGIFAITLSNAEVSQDTIWTTCLQDITIPVGSTTYPLTIQATYSACTNGNTPSAGMPLCFEGRPPPLPPGVYQAKLAQSTAVAPTPPAIDVTLTPSP